ncbi:SMC-Scp complex subunit ScpB [Clostridium polynesiense]|uniref:SMC-Scp complex subunit ScpB n=1 Tax=Clostridium polynesiense TaxID=1325933 RepID=UPI00058AE348|nr:SMC-Scp complex subunit ScpB [Clostridium polynesiense]
MNSLEFEQYEFKEVSNKDSLISIIESLLFVSGEPLSIKEICSTIQCSPEYAKELIGCLSMDYESSRRGIKLININNNYQLVTKPQNSDFIQELLKTSTRQYLSQASLETLSIVAYKQPITRIDIDEIRGVKSDSAVQNLLEKGLIKERGRLDVPGRPILYITTEEFLRQFGLDNLSSLPALEELMKDNNEEAAIGDLSHEKSPIE